MKSFNEIKEISFHALLPEQRDFLQEIGTILDCMSSKGETGIPVYVKINGYLFFIMDYALNSKDVHAFERKRQSLPETKFLYCGGGLIMPIIDNQCVVIYDDRHQWYKLIGGRAQFNEGLDLEATAIREGLEEELVISGASGKNRIISPLLDTSNISLDVHNWGIELSNFIVDGTITTEYTFDEENGCFECVVRWDLPGKPCDYNLYHQEDWFAGGPSGIVPVTLDKNGTITGYWSGRQGYVSFPVEKIHPTLSKFWLDA